MEKSLFEQMGGTYEQRGDYTIPCLTLFLNMRTRDFPAIIPTVPIFSVCFTILKWAKFMPLSATS